MLPWLIPTSLYKNSRSTFFSRGRYHSDGLLISLVEGHLRCDGPFTGEWGWGTIGEPAKRVRDIARKLPLDCLVNKDFISFVYDIRTEHVTKGYDLA